MSCRKSNNQIIIDADNTNSTLNIGQKTSKYSHTGDYSILLTKESKYGFTSKDIKVKGGDRIYGKMYGYNSCNTFNLFAHGKWGHYYASSNIRDCDEQTWSELNLLVRVPDSIINSTIQFYVYYYGNDSAYVDHLVIEKKSKPFFTDSIPEFIGLSLTSELIRELNVNGIFPTSSEFISLIDHEACKKVFEYYDVETKYYIEYFRKNKNLISKVKEYTNNQSIKPKTPKPIQEHNTISGYTDDIVYEKGSLVNVNILNYSETYKAVVFKLGKNYSEIKIKDVGKFSSQSFQIDTKALEAGIYGVKVTDSRDSFNIPLIINEKVDADIILLAPIATWHAYNDFGGKSLYRNRIDSKPVYYVSGNRPLISLNFDSTFLGHDYYVFNNIFEFFSSHGKVTVYPDYYLEKHPELFANCKTIVLAQHCEYFSPKMYTNLIEFSQNKNIISMGGNQVYWKILFKDDFSTIECRKDGTYFDSDLISGGLWRTNLTSEASILGVAYTNTGYATYLPYKVTNANHWLYSGIDNITNETQFGSKGIDQRGISGDETDKRDISSPKNTVVIAKGINPNNGGGEMVIIEKDSVATLSTGSIASGAGLNKDTIFAKIISNFLSKYHH
jgi:hypothetical protein